MLLSADEDINSPEPVDSEVILRTKACWYAQVVVFGHEDRIPYRGATRVCGGITEPSRVGRPWMRFSAFGGANIGPALERAMPREIAVELPKSEGVFAAATFRDMEPFWIPSEMKWVRSSREEMREWLRIQNDIERLPASDSPGRRFGLEPDWLKEPYCEYTKASVDGR